MNWKLLAEGDGVRRYALVFESGDAIMEPLTEFAASRELGSAHFTAIGAFERAELAYFDWRRKEYRSIPVDGQVEVASLIGNISWVEGGPEVHAHTVLGRPDGTAVAGHLMDARVRPTLELFLTDARARLERRHDAASGLALIEPM